MKTIKITKEEEMKWAGVAFFAGNVEFILFMLIAEFIYPHYSVSGNYISDLGVGSTAYIFNTSIIVMGLLVIATGYFIRNFSRILLIVFVLAGIGAMGVGIFNETLIIPHTILAIFAFSMSSIAPYFIIFRIKNIMSVMWVILGTIGLIALVLYLSGTLLNAPGLFLGLGHGGMERMIIYPDLMWGIAFGGWLVGNFANEHVKLSHKPAAYK